MTDLPPSFAPVGFAWATLKDQGINRLRIAGAEELLGAGGALIDATGRSRLKGARFLLSAQTTRAQHTFETVIAAARMGRGVQAAMPNRALLDDVLDIHWTAAHPDEAPERADQHDRMIALAEHDFEDKFNRADRSLTDKEREELKRLMRLYGGGSRAFKAPWHRTSFEECFELVKARWKDEPGADYFLDYIYEVIQRRNNLLLHGSPTAYRQTVVTDAAGRRHINRAGPDRLWPESLAQGAGGYYFVGRVLAQGSTSIRSRWPRSSAGLPATAARLKTYSGPGRLLRLGGSKSARSGRRRPPAGRGRRQGGSSRAGYLVAG